MRALPCFLLLIISCAAASAQRFVEGIDHKPQTFGEASRLIPAWYAAGRFDSMGVFLENWGAQYHRRDRGIYPQDAWYSGVYYPDILYALRVLWSIQENRFTAAAQPCQICRPLLVPYASDLKVFEALGEEAPYRVPYGRKSFFYAASSAAPLFELAHHWAIDLLKRRSNLNPEELYFCNVIAGNIPKPGNYLRRNLRTLPGIDSLFADCFIRYREYPGKFTRRKYQANTGIWLPMGKLASLGAHPSWGLEFGVGSKFWEVDAGWDGRLTGSDPGGTLSLTATRYLWVHTHDELGVIAGPGLDYYENPEKQEFKSPDGETGLRWTYYFHPKLHIGIEAKFHWLAYVNTGGTDLSGDAVSIEFHVGF